MRRAWFRWGAIGLITLSICIIYFFVMPASVKIEHIVPEMVRVKAGSFQMGDEVGDLWFEGRPVHSVTLTYDFLIGKYEVNFQEYEDYCQSTGSRQLYDQGWGQENMPVINVDWREATRYCNWLSEMEGFKPAYNKDGDLLDRKGNVTLDITKVEGYRLPTEAEWEYAASGGHEASPLQRRFLYAGSDDIDEVAWYSGNSGEYIFDGSSGIMDFTNHGASHIKGMSAQPVGQKKPNELGLYDMSGNVWEWCHDWYAAFTGDSKINPTGASSGHVRVIRGGSWIFGAKDCRVGTRFYRSPHDRIPRLGFRVARTTLSK